MASPSGAKGRIFQHPSCDKIIVQDLHPPNSPWNWVRWNLIFGSPCIDIFVSLKIMGNSLNLLVNHLSPRKKKNQLGAKTLQFSDNSMAESDIRHRNWDIACFSWSGTFHINCFAHLRPFSYHSLIILFAIYSMDWRKGNVTGKPHDPIMGKSMVSGEDFPNKTNPGRIMGWWSYPHMTMVPLCPIQPSDGWKKKTDTKT